MRYFIEVLRCYVGRGWQQPTMLDLLPDMLERAVRNKVVCILDDVVERTYTRQIPERLGQALKVLSRNEEARAQEQTDETLRISALLEKQGLRHAVRKGAALSSLYKNPLHRQFEDIDLLIDPTDAERLHVLLCADGYLPGGYNRYTGQPKLPDRAARLQYRLSPDHLPHLHKPVPELVTRAFVLDVAFTSGWYGDAFALDNTAILDRVVKRQGLPMLDTTDCFIDVALHLYREAFLPGTVLRSAPSLRSFLDVLLCHDAVEDASLLWSRCGTSALRQVVTRTLTLVKHVFGEDARHGQEVFSEEQLLHTMMRNGREERVELSLLDRMATLSHEHYAVLMAGQPTRELSGTRVLKRK